ncbi:uncharacterized protein [Dysidea avara]|uniref:uncharacterized protein n=1 Tax=Dysidea avara TaxID=196820 RepID=UPI0033229C81
MKIAIEGCCHGELDKIYDAILELESRDNIKVDLLLCCGDFQAVRNDTDLNCMAVPIKYRQMNTFYKYYSGEKKAPVLTIFIGGNHEASNHLWELGYGGWVAPNIYYLGYSGAVQFGGLCIAGLSGIYKYHDYERGHFEMPPYNGGTVRSTYHVRKFDVFKLKKLKHVDIAMSHDWPRRIYHHGNTEELLRSKPFFRDEVTHNTLGSPPAEELLTSLRPLHWFSAHLHCRFEASYKHCSSNGEVISTTKFLALDKCLPRRHFLEVIDVPHCDDAALKLCYDPDWLAITKATANMFPITKQQWIPPLVMDDIMNTPEDIETMRTAFGGSFKIPENFQQTVKCFDPSQRINHRAVAMATVNPQTQEFCDKLGIANPFVPPEPSGSAAGVTELAWLGGDQLQGLVTTNPDRIDIDSDDDVIATPTDPPPLDTTEMLPLTTETRKRPTNDKPVVIKRRNASLYQSNDDDDITDSSHDVTDSSHDTY